MKKVWLIGASLMAQDYIKVLNALNVKTTVIGRGELNAKICAEAMDCEVLSGGLDNFLESNPNPCSHAIVSVGVEALYETTSRLLTYGVRNILVEKPGALHNTEFERLLELSKEKNANVLIAYNRRFFASTVHAQKIIKEDGGVTSFNFEFTEWAHEIETLTKGEGVMGNWFLANSTHVVDMAFYLGGKPKEICSFTNGSLTWHPTASIFSGAGVSDRNALFSYQANWESAGRWSVEILTKEHRLIFRPMEKLQIQKRGSITQAFDMDVDYTLDEHYKPGLYLQSKKFLGNHFENMCSIDEQYAMFSTYKNMANY